MRALEGRGSSTSYLYAVEACTRLGWPVQVGDMILDKEWRVIRFAQAPVGLGVPAGATEDSERGLIPYETATALMWWWRANLSLADRIGVLTRLVSYKLERAHTITALGYGPEIDGPCRPDKQFTPFEESAT